MVLQRVPHCLLRVIVLPPGYVHKCVIVLTNFNYVFLEIDKGMPNDGKRPARKQVVVLGSELFEKTKLER